MNLKKKINILCIDDEKNILSSLKRLLNKSGYAVTALSDSTKAMEMIKQNHFDVVILDIRMPGINGMDVLKQIKKEFPWIEVIMLTAYSTVDLAVKAIKLGAYDFIQKPFLEEIPLRLEKLIQFKSLSEENKQLKRQLAQKYSFYGMQGKSPVMLNVFETIKKVSSNNSPITILGESGTGKELVARAIPDCGSRKKEPFVTVDCSSISHTVIENELFGHVKGAFTGALTSKDGLIKAAGKGTIFFDEITEIPISIQAKLLRAIQEREFRPVGSTTINKIKARIIAATNRNIQHWVDENKFRQDLFYRINVVTIDLPPLRDRIEDIPLLVKHFIDKYNSDTRKILDIKTETLKKLVSYSWPGNIRELENYIERAFTLGNSNYLEPEDFPFEVEGNLKSNDKNVTLEEIEKQAIMDTLLKVSNNKKTAAKILNIGTATLYRKLKKYNLE